MRKRPASVGAYEVRCHHCSYGIGYADSPVRIVGLFKPSHFGVFPENHNEVRRMCRKCRWLNIFEQVDVSRVIEVKKSAA